MGYNRIVVTTDIYFAGGALRVQAGAVGTISSRYQGLVGVVFDDGQDAFIKPDGGGRLIQNVPLIYTAPVNQ